MTVAARLMSIRERIERAGGDPTAVTIIAVTKGFGPEAVAAAVDAGIEDIGENYARELVDKHDAAPTARWHFLGAVQRNKVARLAPHVACWQGVDRTSAGAEIARRSPGARVLVQVNLAALPGRNGCAWDAAPQLVGDLRALDLDVAGLMGVASPVPELAADEYGRLAALREHLGLRELSIGMSDDLELAIRAGSTMVRIGRALFGARPAAREVRA